MKRFLALILVLSVCVALCCCNYKEKIKSNGSSDEGDISVPSFSQSDIDTLDGILQRDIHSIKWQTVSFTYSSSNSEIDISFPDDWSFKKSGKAYEISRNGTVIGAVTNIPSPKPEQIFNLKSDSAKGFKYSRSVHKNGDRYTYCICFSHTVDTETVHLTIEVDYAELCTAAVTRLINDSLLYNVTDNIRGDLTLKNSSKQIVVCGNSFIGSSQLIRWFNQMCQISGNGYSMQSGLEHMMVSDGHTWNERLKNGEFSAILLCGFYSDDQEDIIKPLKELCKQTNTLLIIFPAHNESPGWVNKALSQNPDLPFIGWQNEIQALIDLGVDYNDMCVDDMHQHTTHLGGYVGAHMIYRSLFKQMPPMIEGTNQLNFSDIKNSLGDYITTGKPASICSSGNRKLTF